MERFIKKALGVILCIILIALMIGFLPYLVSFVLIAGMLTIYLGIVYAIAEFIFWDRLYIWIKAPYNIITIGVLLVLNIVGFEYIFGLPTIIGVIVSSYIAAHVAYRAINLS